MSTRKRTRVEAGLVGNLEELKGGENKSKRRLLNVDEKQLTDFLQQLHDEKYPKKPKRIRKQLFPKFMVSHRVETRMYVVYLRFGSLTEECHPPLRTHRRIFEITGVKPSTQFNMIRSWRQNNYQVLPSRKGYGRKQCWYDEDIKSYLLDPDTLREWAAFSSD